MDYTWSYHNDIIITIIIIIVHSTNFVPLQTPSLLVWEEKLYICTTHLCLSLSFSYFLLLSHTFTTHPLSLSLYFPFLAAFSAVIVSLSFRAKDVECRFILAGKSCVLSFEYNSVHFFSSCEPCYDLTTFIPVYFLFDTKQFVSVSHIQIQISKRSKTSLHFPHQFLFKWNLRFELRVLTKKFDPMMKFNARNIFSTKVYNI